MAYQIYALHAYSRRGSVELLDIASDLPRLLTLRIAQISELLGLDRRRVLGWALAHAMLSACWDLESGMDWEIWVAIARALQDMHL